MSYLILGSTSFAGGAFIDYLLSNGEKVIGISRSSELPSVMQPYYHNPNKTYFRFYQLDLNHDFESIKTQINKHKPRFIIDFAGQGMVSESWEDPVSWYQTNIISKTKLHFFLKNLDFLERYIKISTPEVYGNCKNHLTENQPYNPSTPYAVSHAAIDMSLQVYYKQYRFPVILTRFANFYGPYQQLYRIIPRTAIYALLGKKLQLHGGGTTNRMFVYTKDIASGIHKAIQFGKLGEIYHFANPPCLSIYQVVQKICAMLNIDLSNFIEIASERAGKDDVYHINSTKAQNELQWKPEYSFEQGLECTVRWIKNNIDLLKTFPLTYSYKQ